MKKVVYLLISLLIIACNNKKAPEKPIEPEVEAPTQWLSFNADKSDAKHIVFISGDEEYRSEEALPQLAKILSKHHGFKCTVLFSQEADKPGIVNANHLKNIPGLETLKTADMMVVFTRFRGLPDNQMKHIDDYLMSGKPVMGLRTATHAFNFNKDSITSYKHYGNYYNGEKTEWKGGFGRFILGEKWINHHGHHKHQSTKGIIAPNSKTHPIANGLADGDVWGATDVYGVRLPMLENVQPIILGKVMERTGEFDENDIFYGMKPTDDKAADTNKKGLKLNDPMMPVAWTKTYQLKGGKEGKSFASTVGASSDLLIEGTRRLLVNAVFWGMDMPVPAKANVDLVGEYSPTKFEFRKNEYWEQKQMKISELQN